jgi:hypothetical protein
VNVNGDRLRGYGALVVGAFMFAMLLWDLKGGSTWASMGRGRGGFTVDKAEKPDLYWFNMKVHLGIAVACGVGGVCLLRQRPAGSAPPQGDERARRDLV